MRSSTLAVVALAACAVSLPYEASSSARDALGKRSLISTAETAFINAIEPLVSESSFTGLLSALEGVIAVASPSSVEQATAALQSIAATNSPANIIEYAADLVINGLVKDSVLTLVAGGDGEISAENSETNVHPAPPTSVYPKKSSCDAPYSFSESVLRSAIYIPPTFTYGKKPPVILFPGTGNHGYETFSGSFIPLLTGVSWADPVWVNVPGRMLLDAQGNAEYAAYAINYIAAITGCKVTVAGWSQGSISSQWALKYWPSARQVTEDLVTFSGDYKGTEAATLLCPKGFTECAPSVWQQEYVSSSNFITTLRSNGGDSAYVPTTNIYSGFVDEVVEPQSGTGASAYLLDARNVGVSNVEVQTVCAGYPAGTLYTHEGVLYNPLAFALLKDAMTHDGPGEVSRLDIASVCSTYLTPGLDLGDFLLTEEALLIAAIGVVAGPKTASEPPVSTYATA